jgi:Na+-transporting NADH:ubiquinone oxidoreductase subunit NqrD
LGNSSAIEQVVPSQELYNVLITCTITSSQNPTSENAFLLTPFSAFTVVGLLCCVLREIQPANQENQSAPIGSL